MLKTYRRIAVLAAVAPMMMLARAAHAQADDKDKTAAIKELLTVMQADQAVKGQADNWQQGAKQEAPLVLEQVLVENKTLNDKQKQAAVDKLKKNGAVQRMVDGAARPSHRRLQAGRHQGSLRRLRQVLLHAGNQGPDHVPEVADRPEVHGQPGQGHSGNLGFDDAEVRPAGWQVDARRRREGNRRRCEVIGIAAGGLRARAPPGPMVSKGRGFEG
jgi:hypothetical protein